MKEILKEVWKFHKRSIVVSLLVVVSVISLVFTSSLQGKFIWITQEPSIAGYHVTVPEFSVWILFSFVTVIFFLIVMYWKSR